MIATLPTFIRVPLYPFREVTLASGALITVPWFEVIQISEISNFHTTEAPDGETRNVTTIVLRNGTHVVTSMFEDEVLYYLHQVAEAPYVHYDYSLHQQARMQFSQALRPAANQGKPVAQRTAFQPRPTAEQQRESKPSDSDRVGPPSHCTMCSEPIEDAMTTVRLGDEFYCFQCATAIRGEIDFEGSEQNPSIRSLDTQIANVALKLADRKKKAATAAAKKRKAAATRPAKAKATASA